VAGNEVRFDIVATDKASKQLDQVADKAEQVEKLDPTVDVTADTKQADHSVEGFADQLDKLTDADKVVVLALRAGAAQAELGELATKLATVDAADPDIAVTFDRFNEVSGQLEDLETQIKTIGDTDVDIGEGGGANLEQAQAKLKGLATEADNTKGAVHSMAGNALGDMAATTSGLGPLGEAVGQLTEQALSGEAGLAGLAQAGLGLGAVAGAMMIVQAAMDSFAKARAKVAALKKFEHDDIDAFAESIKKGTDATQDYIDRMTEAGKVTGVVDLAVGKLNFSQIEDLTSILREGGISAEDFAKGVTGSFDDLARFDQAVRATSLSVADQDRIISAAGNTYTDYGKASDNAAQFTAVFGNKANITAGQVDDLKGSTAELRAKMYEANRTGTDLNVTLGTSAGKTQALERAYQELSDTISGDQAFIDLEDQIAAVEDAGNAAIVAQKEANDARRTGAKDATDQQREAEASMRAYQTAVNQTKDDIIHLAATAGANPVELKAALDKVDQGDLNGAKADAEAWSRRNPIVLTAEMRVALIRALGSGLGPAVIVPTITTGSAPTTTVNNFLAAPVAAREMARAQGRRARINGR